MWQIKALLCQRPFACPNPCGQGVNDRRLPLRCLFAQQLMALSPWPVSGLLAFDPMRSRRPARIIAANVRKYDMSVEGVKPLRRNGQRLYSCPHPKGGVLPKGHFNLI